MLIDIDQSNRKTCNFDQTNTITELRNDQALKSRKIYIFNIYLEERSSSMLLALKTIMLLMGTVALVASTPLMIEQKEQFLQKIKTKNIAVFFYGESDSKQYQVFQGLIPPSNQLFEGIEFFYIPASKFKLNRPNPSLSIYRKIAGGEWVSYHGKFDPVDVDRWVHKHSSDPLHELKIQQIGSLYETGKKGFMLIDYGEFELLRTKIYLHQFCEFQHIQCGKVSTKNPLLNLANKLIGVDKSDAGISRLAFWNPETGDLELYTGDTEKVSHEELMEMFEGRQGIVSSTNNGGGDPFRDDVKIELHYEATDL